MVCLKCGEKIPSRVTVNGKVRNFNKRRYCLLCAPLQKRREGLVTDSNGDYHCRLCGVNTGSRRQMCNTCISRVRRYRAKRAAVDYLGGKCNRCDWVGDIAAFEFHHPGDDKEFEIGTASNRAWSVIVDELNKCELLCSRCHRIEHHGIRDEKFLEIANDYGGNLYRWSTQVA